MTSFFLVLFKIQFFICAAVTKKCPTSGILSLGPARLNLDQFWIIIFFFLLNYFDFIQKIYILHLD